MIIPKDKIFRTIRKVRKEKDGKKYISHQIVMAIAVEDVEKMIKEYNESHKAPSE